MKNSILAWLSVGVMSAFLFYQFSNSHHGEETSHNEHNQNSATAHNQTSKNNLEGTFDNKTGNFIYSIGGLKEITIGDKVLKVGENSTEFKLYSMLSNPDFKVDEANKSNNWITLDRTYFKTGSSVLTDESLKQIDNLSIILKAYPNAKIKLGGYTDNKGNEEINKKVSDERARTVLNSLLSLGVNKLNISEEGYGSEHPVCEPNDTESCRAQNRRVDLKVSSK